MNWVGRGVELGGGEGVDRQKSDTTFFCCCPNSIFGAPLCPGSEISTTFFASTQFLEHPFVWDQRFRRPFFAPTQFSEHPFVRDQIFRRHFFVSIQFLEHPFVLWPEMSTTFFKTFFFTTGFTYCASSGGSWTPQPPQSRGNADPCRGAFSTDVFQGRFCNGIFQRTLVVQLTGFATGFRRANGFFQQLSVELPGFFNGLEYSLHTASARCIIHNGLYILVFDKMQCVSKELVIETMK